MKRHVSLSLFRSSASPLCQFIYVSSRMRTMLADLNTHMNYLAPVNRIPAELLSMILKTVEEEEEVTAVIPPPSGTYVDSSLVRMTHVCRHWRQVALGTATLWTCFDMRHRDKSQAFLERSRGLPLSVHLSADRAVFDGFTPEEEASQQSVLADRLYSLPGSRLVRLDLDMFLLPRTLTPLVELQAPNLECLTIASEYESTNAPEDIVSIPLLAGHTATLKALAISPAVNWLPSNDFPNLTHLHLAFPWVTRVLPSDIVTVLERAPRLESLYIATFLRRHGGFPRHLKAIELNHLRSLVFSSWALNDAVYVLKQLTFPSQSLVRLHDMEPCPADHDEAEVLPCFPSFNDITHLDLSAGEYEMFLVADGESSGFWLEARNNDPEEATWPPWFSHLHTMVPLTRITSLHINVHRSHEFWPQALKDMPCVVDLSVVVGETSSPELDQVQYTSVPISTLCLLLSQENPVLCPVMHTLRVQGITVTQRRSSGVTCTLSADELASMLAVRARIGHRINSLDVQLGAAMPEDVFADAAEAYTALQENVDEFRLMPPGPPLCAYKMRNVWRKEDSERYWQIGDDDKQFYIDAIY